MIHPSGHMTFIQRRLNVDTTSFTTSKSHLHMYYDVESTIMRRCIKQEQTMN